MLHAKMLGQKSYLGVKIRFEIYSNFSIQKKILKKNLEAQNFAVDKKVQLGMI